MIDAQILLKRYIDNDQIQALELPIEEVETMQWGYWFWKNEQALIGRVLANMTLGKYDIGNFIYLLYRKP